MIFNMPISTVAMVAAVRAHDKQYRKDKVTPFVVHPLRVGEKVRQMTKSMTFGTRKRLISAAYRHDILEDCPGFELNTYMPDDVMALVKLLTAESGFPGAKIKAIEKLALSPEALLIKLADKADNFFDVEGVSPEAQKQRSRYEAAKLLLSMSSDRMVESVPLITTEVWQVVDGWVKEFPNG